MRPCLLFCFAGVVSPNHRLCTVCALLRLRFFRMLPCLIAVVLPDSCCRTRLPAQRTGRRAPQGRPAQQPAPARPQTPRELLATSPSRLLRRRPTPWQAARCFLRTTLFQSADLKENAMTVVGVLLRSNICISGVRIKLQFQQVVMPVLWNAFVICSGPVHSNLLLGIPLHF